MKTKYCRVCGVPGAEGHHIIFRGKQPGMIHCKLNIVDLCAEHHKGSQGPHLCRKVDLDYKLELQKKLFNLFDKDYYTEYEIKNKLEIPKKDAAILTKILKSTFIDGEYKYAKEDIIRRCMGDKLYDM